MADILVVKFNLLNLKLLTASLMDWNDNFYQNYIWPLAEIYFKKWNDYHDCHGVADYLIQDTHEIISSFFQNILWGIIYDRGDGNVINSDA